jgi:hypothetical protein
VRRRKPKRGSEFGEKGESSCFPPLLWRVPQSSRGCSISSKSIVTFVECCIGLVERGGRRSWSDDGRKKGESFRREFVVL